MSNESMANHITETPSEIAELLAEIQSLQKENEELKLKFSRAYAVISNLVCDDDQDLSSGMYVEQRALKFLEENKECKATIDRLLGGEK